MAATKATGASRRSPLAKAWAATVLVALAILAGQAHRAAAQPVTILTGSDPYYLTIIVAAENGYFTDEGLTVKHRMFPSGTDAMLAFRGVGAEFVASGDAPSLVLWDDGDAVGVAPIYASPDNLLGVVKAEIKSPAELKGKKIGVRKGSTADYFLTAYLTANGVKPADVNIINLSPPECVPSLASGAIDGFFLWQPYPSLAMKVMGDKARTLTTARGYYLEQIYLSANRKFAESNPETVKKVLKALKRAVEFVKTDPEKATAIVARKIKSEPDVVASLVATKPYSMQYAPANKEQLIKLVAFLRENGKLKSQPDIDKAFDSRYLRAADATLVTDR
jgi:sulfonate transport system substrate-binding protein